MASATPARLTVLSGPSGVGKGTVVAEVRRRHPDVWVSVSVTTRRPRPGEVDGDRADDGWHLTGVAGHGGDIVPGGDRLLDQVPSDAAGGGDDGEFHRFFPAVKAARFSVAQVAYLRAGRPSRRRTVSVVGPGSRV